jgi:hypothetical protein
MKFEDLDKQIATRIKYIKAVFDNLPEEIQNQIVKSVYESFPKNTEKVEQIPDTLTGKEVVKMVANIFNQLPIKLSCRLVDSNVILTLAGLKAHTTIYMEIESQEDVNNLEKEIDKLNNMIDKHLRFRLAAKPFPKACDPSITVQMITLENLKGWERISKITKILGVPHFESEKGYDYFDNKWYGIFANNIEDHQYICGIRYCYPDTAIHDFSDWIEGGRKNKLEDPEIAYVGMYDEATPTFSYYPEHREAIDIQLNIKQIESILEEFYESEWHKQMEDKLSFHKNILKKI